MRTSNIVIACVLIGLGMAGCSASHNMRSELDLVISPFEIRHGNRTLTMSESGDLYALDDMHLGRMTKTGVIYDRNGDVIARLMPDGQLQDASGKLLVMVEENGAWRNREGTSLYWSEDGELIVGDKETALKLVPADSPARRAASVFVYMFFTPAG